MSQQNETTAHSLLWKNIFHRRISSEQKSTLEVLQKIPLFESLVPYQLKLLTKVLHTRRYEPNECIFEQGQPGAAIFIIQEGEVSIEIINEQEKKVQLALLEDGTFFGELALLDNSPRSASARATKPTKVLALFRKGLDKLISSEPEISSKIYQSLSILIAERLKATNKLV